MDSFRSVAVGARESLGQPRAARPTPYLPRPKMWERESLL